MGRQREDLGAGQCGARRSTGVGAQGQWRRKAGEVCARPGRCERGGGWGGAPRRAGAAVMGGAWPAAPSCGVAQARLSGPGPGIRGSGRTWRGGRKANAV